MRQINRCIAKEFYPKEISDILCENETLDKCEYCRFFGTTVKMRSGLYVKQKSERFVSLRLTPVNKMIEQFSEICKKEDERLEKIYKEEEERIKQNVSKPENHKGL